MKNSESLVKIYISNNSILGTQSMKNTVLKNSDINITIYLKYCSMCGSLFTATRIDKISCSNNCKVRLSRRINTGAPVPFNRENIVVDMRAIKKLGFELKHIPVKTRKEFELKENKKRISSDLLK